MNLLRWLIPAAGIYFALRILTPLILQRIGDFLVYEDEPESADCIVILSGERGERVLHGVFLYKQARANTIIMSGGPGEASYPESYLMKTQAEGEGVEEKDIITEDRSLSTYQNALYVREIIENKGFESMILVTSPYHSRRAMMHFERLFKGSGVKIISSPAKNAWFNPDKWWTRPADSERVIREYMSWLWHYARRIRDISGGIDL